MPVFLTAIFFSRRYGCRHVDAVMTNMPAAVTAFPLPVLPLHGRHARQIESWLKRAGTYLRGCHISSFSRLSLMSLAIFTPSMSVAILLRIADFLRHVFHFAADAIFHAIIFQLFAAVAAIIIRPIRHARPPAAISSMPCASSSLADIFPPIFDILHATPISAATLMSIRYAARQNT